MVEDKIIKIILKYKPQKEIAAILYITPENVRVLAYRAKKELKKYLESYEMEND